MNCNSAQTRWHTRLDTGKLDPLLDGHMAGCEACRVYASKMSDVVASVVELGLDTEIVPAAVTSRELPVASVSQTRLTVRRWRTALAVAAALVATVTVMLPFERLTSESTIDAPPAKHAALGITLRGESAHDFLAVAETKVRNNVQVFWLYPAHSTRTKHDPS